MYVKRAPGKINPTESLAPTGVTLRAPQPTVQEKTSFDGLKRGNSMKVKHRKRVLGLCLAACLVSSAIAVPPPNVVPSDTNANTAAGTGAMASFDVGGFNTALGFNALSQLTIGGHSTALGAYALAQNPGSEDNTAVGSEVMRGSTKAAGNTGVGARALLSLTVGFGNVAMGSE